MARHGCPLPPSHTLTDCQGSVSVLEVMLMGDFNYISLLPYLLSPSGAADMSLKQTQATLIKGLVLVLNSLLLERPAFISLAQQTTDTHWRLKVRTRLHSYTQITCVCLCFGPELQRLLRKMGAAAALLVLEGVIA